MCMTICYVESYMIEILFTGLPAHPPNSVRFCAGCCITQITGSLAGFKSLILAPHRLHLCINMYMYMIQILYDAMAVIYDCANEICINRVT